MHMRSPRTLAIVAAAAAAIVSGTTLASPRDAVASTSLTVNLRCDENLCYAYAAGGSGTGYSFEWLSAAEIHDADGHSYAAPNCAYLGQTVWVNATVTDSNGATASEWYPAVCEQA